MRNWKISKIPLIAIFVFIIGLITNYYASEYAIDSASNSVSDIVLSNIPAMNVDALFVFGPIVFWIVVACVLIYKPKKIPFALQSIGLLLITRAMFVTLTHIGPFPTHAIIDYNFFGMFTSGGDLFFSGHTALPFMMALVFWKNIRLRILFICTAIFFGTVVLLGHLHYSIDVAGAFFITYTVYHIATILFKESYNKFNEIE